MKRILLLLLIPTLLVASGCASKKYAKKGDKYEQAGMWEQAAESYMRSLSSKRDNIDAIVGLKRTGQRTVDEKCLKVLKSYESDAIKETVYGYLDVLSFKNRASALGAELSISDRATDYFNEAKPKYIEQLYSDAQKLLDSEKFAQAETTLMEIESIEPGYANVQEMLKVSRCEPLYRQGKEYMTSGLNRKAYANFDRIIKDHAGYKDSKELKEESLQKAMITIKVDNFAVQAGTPELATRIQGAVVSQINSLNNPFIKIVDTENTQQIIDEQRRSVTVGSDVQIGKILGAKSILSASLVEYNLRYGKLEKVEKRGYLKEVTTTKNKETGAEEKLVSYKKVVYFTYNIKNTSLLSLKYQLTSIETGAVMVSDVVREYHEDEANYATFDGDDDKLVPGYWEHISKDSPKDFVSDNQTEVSALKKLLKAKKNVETVPQLTEKAISEIAKKTAQKINKYNPEQ